MVATRNWTKDVSVEALMGFLLSFHVQGLIGRFVGRYNDAAKRASTLYARATPVRSHEVRCRQRLRNHEGI